MFVGREEELNILNRLYNTNKFEFGYIYGQRRIGKTYLVDEFCKDKKSLVFFASDIDDNTIRTDFSALLAQKLGQSGINFSNWDSFFVAVSSYFGDENGVMVIDEYPNILLTRDGKRKKTDFVSKLQNAIDRIFSKQKFLLILTGSNVSFMEKEVKDTKAPLYQRNTFQLMISKLIWKDAVKMLDGMSEIDKIKTLCLTDTFPFYISNIDTTTSFEDNLDRLFFNRESLFINDPSKLLTSEIEASGLYSGIMRNLSAGNNTISSLSKALGVESDVVSIYLDKLIKHRVVSKHYMYNSKRNTYYKIIDRMTSFYFRFISSQSENIKLGYGNLIKNEILIGIDNFIHHSFEDVSITYLTDKSKRGELNGLFLDFQNYTVENSILGRSIEIDIVSEARNKLLVGECKLSNNKKGIDVLERMMENTSVPPFNSYSNIDYYIFSASGFTDSLKKAVKPNIFLIDLNDMFN